MGRTKRRIRSEDGYTLAVVVVLASVILVTLSEAVLNWQTAMKREREEELIFRGKQYQRALVLWYAHWSRTLGTPQVPYPSTIDALLNTNNKRFLRKKWKDPITNGEWRLIKVGPNNRPLLTTLPNPAEGSSLAGRNPYESSGAGQSQGTGQQAPGRTFSTGGQTAYGQPIETQPLGSSVMGGIAGVASTSEEESLKTFNGRNQYNEWEFFIDFAALAARTTLAKQAKELKELSEKLAAARALFARSQRGPPGQTPQQLGQSRPPPQGSPPPVERPPVFGAPGQAPTP